MQGQHVNGAAAPLNQRFTLVIMTHNRPRFLQRTLQYYGDYPGHILVLDSSTESSQHLFGDYPQVEYHHLPQFGYWGAGAKIAHGLNLVKTPYMCFAADDDFLLHDALTQSVEFLEAHPDYGVCHGYGMMYVAFGTDVRFFRRDKRVCEDYCSDLAQERVVDFLGQFLPPFYAVTRTELLQQWYSLVPLDTRFEWHEVGHSFFLLACAKARILPIPFAVREANYGGSEHSTNVLTVLALQDEASVQERERFAEFLASLPTGLSSMTPEQGKQVALESFKAMAEGLLTKRALDTSMILRSDWRTPDPEPVRTFAERQFVEMPFYNQPMFDRLTEFEFLIHALPAARHQLKVLEPILLRQWELMQVHDNDNERTVRSRLWQALELSPFNRAVVERLLHSLEAAGEEAEAAPLRLWLQRLQQVRSYDSQALLDSLPSGRLLKWLESRKPAADQVRLAAKKLAHVDGGPSFGIVLLDLKGDMSKLQATFDSLMAGHCRNFKVVVLTAGDLPAATDARQTVHFVKVAEHHSVEQINLAVSQLGTEWVLLAQAGDSFTAGGLLRASLELLGADGVRAVAMDEIQRQPDGCLLQVSRPGASLDMLQSAPGLMARHWLVRRELVLEVGGYAPEFSEALEFDLLLRLIGQGGLGGLAHLAEPLLICDAGTSESTHEQLSLSRRLAERGYAAKVDVVQPGAYHIDYGHRARPMVSIVLHCQDNLLELQACMVSLLQQTRYHQHEILLADNASQSLPLHDWLTGLSGNGERVRVVRSDVPLSPAAMLNQACQEARGEYLVLLDSAAQVLNANWLEGLLNQAQRPEVGVVGAKLLDAQGKISQAGLILGGDGGVVPAFAGEAKDAPGYMQRLRVAHNVSAVSTCLMLRTSLFLALDGLQEQGLNGPYAEVDLCLRVAEAGYLTVWTPQAQVVRGGEWAQDTDALATLRRRWPDQLQHDPLYNRNHSQGEQLFELCDQSSVDWEVLVH